MGYKCKDCGTEYMSYDDAICNDRCRMCGSWFIYKSTWIDIKNFLMLPVMVILGIMAIGYRWFFDKWEGK